MSIYFQINKDMDPSQKRILEGQWTEICNQRAEMEESKNAPMKNLLLNSCLLYTSPSPRDRTRSRMPSSA